MKAQVITSTDFRGRHNADLEGSSSRIRQSGTWKKQRVCVVLPSSDLIPAQVALSHWSIIFPPNQGVHRCLALGHEVGDAYSNCISDIIAHPQIGEWEFILTIEADNMPPADGLLQLIKDMEEHPEFAGIGGLYWCKGEGGVPHLWGDPKDPAPNFRPQVPLPNTLQEVCGTSMGFNLWRVSLFKDTRLRRPWFKTLASSSEGVGTQDLYFAGDAKKYGYRFAIDTRVLVGHLDFEGKFGPAGTIW